MHKRSIERLDYYVSIPFKREGLSERIFFCLVIVVFFVSIPFKREGLSERTNVKFR